MSYKSTIYILVLLLSGGLLTAQSVESFNYDTGTALDGLQGGINWGGPWNVRKGGDETIIAAGGITVERINLNTGSNHLFTRHPMGAGGMRVARKLPAMIDDDGGVYWLAWSQDTDFEGEPADNGSVAQVMITNDVALGAGGPAGQRVRMGKIFGTERFGIDGINAGGNKFIDGTDIRESMFVVVKIDLSGDAAMDEISIWINPDPMSTLLDTASASINFQVNLNDGFDAVGYKVEGGAALDARLDEVRFSSNLSDVMPGATVDPPARYAQEKFNDYTPGETLDGLNGGSGWAGPWMAFNASGNSVIRDQGLINNVLSARTSGNSLQLTATGMTERSLRIFASPLDTTANADFWFSAHLAAGGSPAGTVGNFILADTTAGGIQQVIIGKQFGNRNIFAVGDGQIGGASQTNRQFDESGGASFIVGHMTRDTGVWALDLYVDPDPTATDLSEEAAQIINKTYRSGNFNGVIVRTDGGGTGLTWDVDDILFGGSYAEVVPDDLENAVPAPPGATEPFSYVTGDILIGKDGGNGWTDPWRKLSGNGNGTIEEGGIISLPNLMATAGPNVRFNNYTRAVRPLQGVYGDVGRDFWLGWWFDVDEGGGNVAHLVLADTATYAAGGLGGQLAQIGKLFNGAIGVVSNQGGAAGGSASGVNGEAGHFMVAHIITDGTPAGDQILLWVDPDLEAGTPSADTANVMATADLTNWNGIGIKFEGNADQLTTVAFDDILLGFSYNDIIPNGLVDVADPTLPTAAVETFDYESGQDLNGAEGGSGWAGPWEAISGTMTVTEGNVNSPRTCGEEGSNAASLDQMGVMNEQTPTLYRRSFLNPFGTDIDNSTFYLSFVLNIDGKDIGNSGLVSVVSGDQNLLSIGGVPGLPALAAVRNSETTATTTNDFRADGTKWFVIRMDVNPASNTATARVFVDPAADAIPTDASATFTIDNIDVFDGITGITIGGAGVQTVSLLVDDIRAGFSYRDISCQFGSDDPDLLAYEPFNYDANTSLLGAGGVNAFWDGPWLRAGDFVQSTAIIQAGSLDQPGIAEEANKVEMDLLEDNLQLRIDRELAFPIESDGRTYWLSFFMNTTVPDALNNVSNVMLMNPAISTAGGQRIGFGRLYGNGKLGVPIPQGTSRATEIDDAGFNWIVARIETNTDSEVDTVTVWINPPATGSAPDTSDASRVLYFNTPRFKDGITAVRLKVEGAGGGQFPYTTQFDEIKIATAWSSVTGIMTSVDPLPADRFRLSVYPNPFSNELTIAYELAAGGNTTVDLLNVNGQLARRLYTGIRPGGEQQQSFAVPADLSNGFYFLRVVHNGKQTVRKLVLYR